MAGVTAKDYVMAHTYYEVLDIHGNPATARQEALYGTAKYGYATRTGAERACPNGGAVHERHTDGSDSWAGRVVSYRGHDGWLHIIYPRSQRVAVGV